MRNTTVIPTKNVIQKFLIKVYNESGKYINTQVRKKSKELDHYLKKCY